MYIRRATYDDIPRLMEIFASARRIMRESGNINQWNDSYPSEQIVRNDINDDVCKVLCDNNHRIIATMAFIPGPDPTYKVIKGKWLNDDPYYVIHRIATSESGHGTAGYLLKWAEDYLAGLDNESESKSRTNLRIDTHRDNVIMHHIMKKTGFKYCGIIHLANGDPRDAFQK